MESKLSPKERVALLVDGYQATQLLFVAVDLGLADRLASGPRAVGELAPEVGVDPGALHRLLRGLASFGVFEELGEGRFGLNEAAELLREGRPGSFRGLLLARGELYYGAFGRLRDAVRGGGNAFEMAYGKPFFEHLDGHPEQTAAFQQSMADRARQEVADVVAAYDFGRFGRLVDVGGGRGALVAAIAAANPALSAVLFDQPAIADRALDLPGNCEIARGDFFASVPGGADAYMLSRVIHDWDDDAARRILVNCREAMPADGTLLLVEALLPERAVEAPAAIRMDINMLTMFDGKERTEAEFAGLFAAAGFRPTRTVAVDRATGLHILEARPA